MYIFFWHNHKAKSFQEVTTPGFKNFGSLIGGSPQQTSYNGIHLFIFFKNCHCFGKHFNFTGCSHDLPLYIPVQMNIKVSRRKEK